jgi:hypothetical protein
LNPPSNICGRDITTITYVPDKIVVRLLVPLVKLGCALLIDSYYSLPSVQSLQRQWRVTGTLHLNRKHVPELITCKKLVAECSTIRVMKWRHKRKVLFVSMFHDSIMQTQPVNGTAVS